MTPEADGDPQVNEDGQVATTSQSIARQRLQAVVAAALTNRRRAVLISGGVVLAICLLVLIGFNLFRSTPRVTLYTVHTTLLHTTIGGGGLVYPAQTLDVAYPISAQVTKVNVQVGQMVQPGQSLVTLDSAALTSRLSEAYSEWQIAVIYVSTLQAQGSSAKQIAGAEQQAAIAKSRYDTLFSQINSTAFNKGNIVSTFTGVVTDINVTSGSYFNSNATLMTIEDQSNLIVRAELPLDQANQIKTGQPAEVVSDSRPNQPVTGTVTAIIPSLSHQGNSTFMAWITVPNSSQALFTNESVYVRVNGQQTLPTVPELAVVNPNSDSIVYVFDHGIARATHVVVGARDGDKFGIISGLQPGQQVVLVGQQQLTDNQQVIVSAVQP